MRATGSELGNRIHLLGLGFKAGFEGSEDERVFVESSSSVCGLRRDLIQGGARQGTLTLNPDFRQNPRKILNGQQRFQSGRTSELRPQRLEHCRNFGRGFGDVGFCVLGLGGFGLREFRIWVLRWSDSGSITSLLTIN